MGKGARGGSVEGIRGRMGIMGGQEKGVGRLGKGLFGGIVQGGRYQGVCKEVWRSLEGQKEEVDQAYW